MRLEGLDGRDGVVGSTSLSSTFLAKRLRYSFALSNAISTKGKIGGTRGHVVQCRQCNSLWAFDQEGAKGFIGHLGPTHHRQGEGTQRRDAIGAVLLAAAKIQTSTSTQDCDDSCE